MAGCGPNQPIHSGHARPVQQALGHAVSYAGVEHDFDSLVILRLGAARAVAGRGTVIEGRHRRLLDHRIAEQVRQPRGARRIERPFQEVEIADCNALDPGDAEGFGLAPQAFTPRVTQAGARRNLHPEAFHLIHGE